MPDSYGKRQRRNVKARKAAAKEQRRLARHERRSARAAGLHVDPPGVGEDDEDPRFPPSDEGAEASGAYPAPPEA
jgi:hypothetical protein